MTETIKVDVDASLARRFRKKAMESYGYKKGAVKKATEELMRRFITGSRANWAELRGKLKSKKSSVELQHDAMREAD